MDNQYVIHDAEKEKPERIQGDCMSDYCLACNVKAPQPKDRAMGWFSVWYDFTCNTWRSRLSGERRTVTHWTSLPPAPPKPKRWVKREIEPNVVQVKEVGSVNCDVFAEAYGLPKVRNVMLTYEIEEES